MSTKEYLIKSSYDSAGIKRFTEDVNKAKAVAEGLGTTLSRQAKVIDQTVTSSLDRAGNKIRTISTIFDDSGKRFRVNFGENFREDLVRGSASISGMTETINKFGNKIQTLNTPLSGIGAKLTSLSSLNRTFGQSFGDSFKGASLIVEQLPEKLSQKKISFGGTDALVPVQQLATVVATADGSLQKLNQTVTTLPNGVKQISRSMSDVTKTFHSLREAEAAVAKTSENTAVSFQRVALSSEQAEKGARFFTSGLTKNAVLMDINSKSLNKNGQEILRTTAVFNDSGKKITTVFDSTSQGMGKVSQASNTLRESVAKADIDLGKLISRAAVTIPIWFALRAAVMGVIFGLRDGVKNVIEFDEALQKVKRNLIGTPQEVASQFSLMKKEITEFSLATGKPVEEIAEAIKQFATIGFSFKDSLSGGLDATKLSIALFGKAGETAKAFAVAMKLLIKEEAGMPPVSQQMSEGFALVAELAKTNKDELGELSQAFEKIAGPAAVAKLSFKETATILLTLASSGKAGAQGATLLGTSLTNLLTNLPKISKDFGITFTPGLDSAYTTLTKILDVASAMASTPAGEVQVFAKLGDVFGGQRGVKLISALVAANEALKTNAQMAGDVAKFNQGVSDVLDSESGQAKILTNSLREMGKSFITNLVGANDFKGAISNIHSAIVNIQPVLEKFAVTLNSLFHPSTKPEKATIDIDYDIQNKKFQDLHLKLVRALKGEMSKVELEQFKIDFSKIKSVDTVEMAKQMPIIKDALEKALSKEEVTAKVSAKIGMKPTIKGDGSEVIIPSLENELAELKARLKANGATDIQLSLLDIDFLKSQGEAINHDKIRDEQSKIRVATIEKERSIQDQLLKAVEDGAKAEGASNLEAIVRRIELEKQLGIERKGMDLLTQQLELQKALTEETKKTRAERLKELETLVKSAPSQFFAKTGQGELQLSNREQALRLQASQKGISDDQINKILSPETTIASGLLRDIQIGLTSPMTKSMGSLESAITGLTRTILQQETVSTGASVPRMNVGGGTYKGQKSLRPLSPEEVQKLISDF